MTSEHVKDYLLNSGQDTLRSKCSEVTEYICGLPGRSSTRGTSRRIFALLLIMDEPARILDIMEGAIDDTDLPFYCVDSNVGDCFLARKTGGTLIRIQSLCSWPYILRSTFYKDQWRVQAPVFFKAGRALNRHPVHRFENDIIFPWTGYDKEYDGNSEVARIKIHEAHCRFEKPCVSK